MRSVLLREEILRRSVIVGMCSAMLVGRRRTGSVLWSAPGTRVVFVELEIGLGFGRGVEENYKHVIAVWRGASVFCSLWGLLQLFVRPIFPFS